MLPYKDSPLWLISEDGVARQQSELTDVAIFPGAFNPLHLGHCKLKEAAEKRLGLEVVFEISVANVEKTLLTHKELNNRLVQLRGSRVAVTNAPEFQQKSRLFRQCQFVVGFDTAIRILDKRFYNNDHSAKLEALRLLQNNGHKFVVGGRRVQQNSQQMFLGVENLDVPKQYRCMFVGLSETEFREDISSTQLRNNSG